eukprot:CAMPEP_0172190720 /NCGR_PEP_ID=MMETSP1050-20130122/23276_1 /TAXON_ID=233186 /ORGANISM="Cryptomonas curvata, Strain CCAP979/52" /LENGTH=67 /DNA_ID=CAMNT_0012865637 /DNA_START=17 /DNA_END=220 /DNA_ORIENTATION=+
MFSLLRQLAAAERAVVESLSSCTVEASGGMDYGTICYDVGGCCSISSVLSNSDTAKLDNAAVPSINA